MTIDSGFPYFSALSDATMAQYSAHINSKLSKLIYVDICQLTLILMSEPLILIYFILTNILKPKEK